MNVIEKIAGRRVVLSVSGGKDSAAASLYLRELGIEHDRVFADTGWDASAFDAAPPHAAWLHLDGWAGRWKEAVFVVGETPTRYRIRAETTIRLAGRARTLPVGQTTLVPKRAIEFIAARAKASA